MALGYIVPHAIPYVNIISYSVEFSQNDNTTRNGISARGNMPPYKYYKQYVSKSEKKRLRKSLIIGSEIKIDETLLVY